MAASRRKAQITQEKTPDYAAIGEMLQDTRRSYGMELEQVALILHVKPSLIAALEKGRLEDIPGGLVYAKGHLRSYAQYLGVNLATMLSLLMTETEIKPVASVSSAYGERRRTRMAVVLSAVIMLLLALLWLTITSNQPAQDVSLVKPLPDTLNAYLDAGDATGLNSPCIRETAAADWPPCYTAKDERLLKHLQAPRYSTILQVTP